MQFRGPVAVDLDIIFEMEVAAVNLYNGPFCSCIARWMSFL